MDTLAKLQYIRERINEAETESFNCLEKDNDNMKLMQERLIDLQKIYMGCNETATPAG